MIAIAAWFTPARRKAIYGLVALLGAMLVTAGILQGHPISEWVVLVQAVLGLLFGGMAAIAARRWDWTVLYSVSAIASAAVGVGLLTSGMSDTVSTLIAQIVTVLPPLLAALRTDTTTETGEPAAELAARRAIE